MSLGPTIYPLAFAAIGSRCLRNIAVRLAEHGTTILVCECASSPMRLIDLRMDLREATWQPKPRFRDWNRVQSTLCEPLVNYAPSALGFVTPWWTELTSFAPSDKFHNSGERHGLLRKS